ncbi:MAG: glycosyltransferase [Ardenticatenaceae bacterium]|nr:glycosyltransferase [Ardenticatenaceae bacterium]
MRIGMVTACYKPVVNGVTRMVALYKQHLEAAGHEVTIFTLGEPDPAGDEPGVVRSPAVSLGDTGYYWSMRYTRAAQALLQQMDIIHCHHLYMSVEMAHRYGRCPIVYTNHTRYDLYMGTYIPISQPAADAVMRQVWPDFTDLADMVIVPSESVRQVMLDFGVTRPMVVIENGVDLRPFHHPTHPLTKTDLGVPESAVLFIYIGRLADEKNLDLLLQQFAIAQDIMPHMHLLLVGSGPSTEELKQLAAELQIAPSVHFAGPIPYENISNYLAAADAFVTASTSEVHPLTVIEAMAAGLPVVAVASPGIVDTVTHGTSGLLTRHATSGLAAALVAMALDAARRQQMAQAAQRDSQRFDIGQTVSRTIQLYNYLRQTRPDLQRDEAHGRWTRTRERLQPHLDQLISLIKPPDKMGTSPLRKLFEPVPPQEEKRD